jgi:hypothetical protein
MNNITLIILQRNRNGDRGRYNNETGNHRKRVRMNETGADITMKRETTENETGKWWFKYSSIKHLIKK